MDASAPEQSVKPPSRRGRSASRKEDEGPFAAAPSPKRARRRGPLALLHAAEGEEASRLLELTDDTLAVIFAVLPLDARARLATSCRRLCAISSRPDLWKGLRFAGVTCRFADPYATLRALLARACAVAGDAFCCLHLGGSLLTRLVEVSDDDYFCDAGAKLQRLLAAEGLGSHLLELELGDAFPLLPKHAAALAAACPRLRSATFRLAFDGPGAAALADGARLPRGCHVSVEGGAKRLCVLKGSRRDRELRDAFSAVLAAVGAAGGSLSAASTHKVMGSEESNSVAGLVALAATSPAALGTLTKLDLRDCIIPPDGERSALAAVLGSCPQLQSVRLSGQNLTPLELRTVAALPTLYFLDVSYKPTEHGADYAAALRAGLDTAAVDGHCTRRLSLAASCCALHDAGVVELAAAISGGAGVRRLYLHGNGIADAGATALADALVICGAAVRTQRASSLHVLSLASNDVGAGGVIKLASALQAPGVRLRRLKLCGNACMDDGAAALAEALAAPGCPLEELQLRACGVGFRGAIALAAAIETAANNAGAANNASATAAACPPRLPTMLKVLDLDRNAVGDVGAAALARALATPGCALERLSLKVCGVMQPGALALAAALRRNCSLKLLQLTSNAVTKRGMLALLSAMGGTGRAGGRGTNTTLSKLIAPRRLRPELSVQTMERLQERVKFVR